MQVHKQHASGKRSCFLTYEVVVKGAAVSLPTDASEAKRAELVQADTPGERKELKRIPVSSLEDIKKEVLGSVRGASVLMFCNVV